MSSSVVDDLFEDLLTVEPDTAPVAAVITSTGIADDALLRITFPTASYLGKELVLSRIRFAGWCLPGSTLTVNGKPVRVFPRGGFAGIEALDASSTTVLAFRAETPHGTAVRELILLRKQRRPLDPSALVDRVEVLSPDREMLLAPGDVVRFSCRTSSGAVQAWVQLGTAGPRVPLQERADSRTNGTAIYEADHVIATDHPIIEPTRPFFGVQGRDGRSRVVQSSHVLGVAREPRLVRLIQDAWLFTESAGDRLHPYPAHRGLMLLQTGIAGGMCRVSPDGRRTFYVPRDRVQPVAGAVRLARRILRSAVVRAAAVDRLEVSLSFSAVPLYLAELSEDPDALIVTFFNTTLDTGWTRSQLADASRGAISYRETGDGTVVCTIRPATGRQVWGYDIRAINGSLVIEVTVDPPRSTKMHGVRVFVDAGHGGADLGAVGPVGVREKDVNLTIARELARLLIREGATVIESRIDDSTLSWQDRFARARESRPHLYLCVHNNSVPDTTDPLGTRGVSAFYQTQRGRRLAEQIVREHVALGIPEAYLVWRTPYRGLPSGPVFVVIESAFLSHPADEEILSDAEMLRRIAAGTARAVRRFVDGERRILR